MKQIEDHLWTATRTRGGGRNKSQGGNLQKEVVRSRSPIKWSNATNQDGYSSKAQQVLDREMERNYKRIMVLQTAGQLGNTTEVDYMRFKDTLKQKYKHEEYPQVRKTGVDAVHESCPQRSNM